jgi:inner membrane protein
VDLPGPGWALLLLRCPPLPGLAESAIRTPRPMPSPIGHALAGITVGMLCAPALRRRSAPDPVSRPPHPGDAAPHRFARRRVVSASALPAACAAIALVPDLDLLFGTHSTYTHSLGAVVLAYFVARVPARQPPAVALALALAWATHLLLDWLGSDTSAPIGIMALWPFTTEHYQSSLYVFDAISRRYWMGQTFVLQNLKAVTRELLILGPIVWLAARVARGRHGWAAWSTTASRKP